MSEIDRAETAVRRALALAFLAAVGFSAVVVMTVVAIGFGS